MRTLIIGCGAVALLALTACSTAGGPGKVVTITVPASTTPVTSPSSSPRATVSTVPAVQTKLPGTCTTLLPDYTISEALGGTQVKGKDEFVVGPAEKDIGRLAYLNCRYGVSGSADLPKIEIGISLYGNSAQASARIRATVADYTAHGASAAAEVVGGVTGMLLTGGTGADYDVPLLVASADQRTVAVGVDPSVASGAGVAKTASTLATLALRVTAS